MPRLLKSTIAASAVMLSVTGPAWAVFPSIITFENDTDTYEPTSRDMLNDFALSGEPPTFPGPPNGVFYRDIRTGYAGVVEEVASGHDLGQDGFAPQASDGTHMGMVNFEGNDGAYGFPMQDQGFPGQAWSFQTDIYTDPALPHVNNGLPTFWWTNSIVDHNGDYLTEQGFQVYVGSANGRPSSGNPPEYWSFTQGGNFNPNDPNHDELGLIPVGTWVTMETVFDFSNADGDNKIYGIQKLWSKDRTILYGEERNIMYNANGYGSLPGHNISDAGGPGYTWLVYPNPGAVSALFVDNVGIGPQITLVIPPASEKFWDTNGTSGGAGGGGSPSGAWNGIASNFNSDSGGGAGTMSGLTTAADTVVFSAGSDATGSYTVTVTGTQAAAQLRVEEGSVTFNGGSIATSAVDVATGSSSTVNSVLTGGANAGLVKSGGGTLTLTAPNYTGNTDVNGGTLVSTVGFKAEGSMTIADGAKAVVPETGPSTYNPGNNEYPSGSDGAYSVVSSLTINGSGQLDLGNSDLAIDHNGVSPMEAVRDMLASGYNGGGWDGPGIISSGALNTDPSVFALGYAENADLPTPYGMELGGVPFFGQDVDGTTLLIKFTWVGDLNLDGLVNFEDLSVFNTNFDNGATSGRHWFEGDFNYDGFIDFQDLSLFNTGYDESKPSVPEPGSLTLLAGAALGCLGRRSRRRVR